MLLASSSPCWETCFAGCTSVQGKRNGMEDEAILKPNMYRMHYPRSGELTPAHLFAVFDGHGGPDVARYCKTHFTTHLERTLRDSVSRQPGRQNSFVLECGCDDKAGKLETKSGSNPSPCPMETAMIKAFHEINKDISQDPELSERAKWMGTTALATLLDSSNIWTANCGDCRAVLARLDAGANGVSALALSQDHKASCQSEAARVAQAGGFIVHNSGPRVMGVLAVTRAIGDLALHSRGVTATPEVQRHSRSDSDIFLILASDGLWDVLHNQEAVDLVHRVFQRVKERGISGSASDAAARVASSVLTRVALSRGSADNITAIVIDLRRPPSGAAALKLHPTRSLFRNLTDSKARDVDQSPKVKRELLTVQSDVTEYLRGEDATEDVMGVEPMSTTPAEGCSSSTDAKSSSDIHISTPADSEGVLKVGVPKGAVSLFANAKANTPTHAQEAVKGEVHRGAVSLFHSQTHPMEEDSKVPEETATAAEFHGGDLDTLPGGADAVEELVRFLSLPAGWEGGKMDFRRRDGVLNTCRTSNVGLNAVDLGAGLRKRRLSGGAQ